MYQNTKIQLSYDVCYIIESVHELLCCSWLLESSFLPRGIENGQLLQYDHASICTNVKTMNVRMCAYSCVLQNGVKMETLSPQNDRITELNVKLLLTTTVLLYG